VCVSKVEDLLAERSRDLDEFEPTIRAALRFVMHAREFRDDRLVRVSPASNYQELAFQDSIRGSVRTGTPGFRHTLESDRVVESNLKGDFDRRWRIADKVGSAQDRLPGLGVDEGAKHAIAVGVYLRTHWATLQSD